jgi:hypothetical protein
MSRPKHDRLFLDRPIRHSTKDQNVDATRKEKTMIDAGQVRTMLEYAIYTLADGDIDSVKKTIMELGSIVDQISPPECRRCYTVHATSTCSPIFKRVGA